MPRPKRAVLEYRNYELPPEFPLLVLTGDSWHISPVPSKHLHIHNNHGVNDEHLPLGEGVIPMEQILDLAGEQTEATFTIENMQAENSVTWLLEKGYIQ